MRDFVIWIVSIGCVVGAVASSVTDIAVHSRQPASDVRPVGSCVDEVRGPDLQVGHDPGVRGPDLQVGRDLGVRRPDLQVGHEGKSKGPRAARAVDTCIPQKPNFWARWPH